MISSKPTLERLGHRITDTQLPSIPKAEYKKTHRQSRHRSRFSIRERAIAPFPMSGRTSRPFFRAGSWCPISSEVGGSDTTGVCSILLGRPGCWSESNLIFIEDNSIPSGASTVSWRNVPYLKPTSRGWFFIPNPTPLNERRGCHRTRSRADRSFRRRTDRGGVCERKGTSMNLTEAA